jgi:hypothetical protein
LLIYKHKQRETKTPSQNKMNTYKITKVHESGKRIEQTVYGKKKDIELYIKDSYYDTNDRVKEVIFN